jgi:hypothetical protein
MTARIIAILIAIAAVAALAVWAHLEPRRHAPPEVPVRQNTNSRSEKEAERVEH